MPKYINEKQNLSLSELEWEPGELVGFDNHDFDPPNPFLLTFPERIIKGFDKSNGGMRLVYWADNGEREEWTLFSEENILELWSPSYDRKHHKIPYFNIIKGGYPHGNGYVPEIAIAGENNIREYLKKQKNLDGNFYADKLKMLKSKMRRGILERVLERTGLKKR